MHPQTFLFIGRSGCGKGTQAELLAAYLKKIDPTRGIFRLETGNAFREFIASDGYSQSLSRETYEKGGIQPEFLVIWIWGSAFVKRLQADDHLILDGTPRKFHEAHVLDSAFKFYRRRKPHFIFLNVSREWAKNRLEARKRADDTARDIQARLDWYETDVVKAIAVFRGNPDYHFIDVDGEQPIEKVHRDIVGALAFSK